MILVTLFLFQYRETGKSDFTNEEIVERESTGSANNTFVKFRTYKLDYSAGNAVAFGNACDGNNLNRYGRTHETCFSHLCSEEPELFILSENLKIKFWSEGEYVCVCDLIPQSDIAESYARIYSKSDSDAVKVDTSGISINPKYEIGC